VINKEHLFKDICKGILKSIHQTILCDCKIQCKHQNSVGDAAIEQRFEQIPYEPALQQLQKLCGDNTDERSAKA
jgi:hypothetical protein